MDDIHPLKAFRANQKPPLSQSALAELVGVARETVARWETGERKPEIDQLEVISAKTGISPGRLRPDLAKLFTPPFKTRRRAGSAA